jgi:hypothetical protein
MADRSYHVHSSSYGGCGPASSALAPNAPYPDDPGSIFQDTSIEVLQSRGVKFMSCHTATEERAHALVQRIKLSQAPEEIVKNMHAHTQPNVLVNASMVSAIALMQAEGHYTYITL